MKLERINHFLYLHHQKCIVDQQTINCESLYLPVSKDLSQIYLLCLGAISGSEGTVDDGGHP